MENFTPISALAGGALIGLSAVMLMGLNGRIAGISGIFSGALFSQHGDRIWRVLFVLGLIIAPLIYKYSLGMDVPFEMSADLPLILVGGVLVGFGTRLGSGCTSGHGICGMSRLSLRSIFSVLVFMAAGMLTVAVAKQFWGV